MAEIDESIKQLKEDLSDEGSNKSKHEKIKDIANRAELRRREKASMKIGDIYYLLLEIDTMAQEPRLDIHTQNERDISLLNFAKK